MQMTFPSPHQATEEGLIAVGGDLSVDILIEAYESGIFPWPQEDMPLLWFSPDPRGVIDFSELHIPESLQKFMKKNTSWRFSQNEAFAEVVRECRLQPRPGQKGTWILPEMETAYLELQKLDKAISIECWEGQELVGGIYGVLSSEYFSGESMFFKRDNASKLCLLHLIEVLKGYGHTWIDIQMVTQVLSSLGGKYISRDEFLKRIGE